MTVRPAAESEQSAWDEFVLTAPQASFLQTWAWGEMQARLGVPNWRLVATEGERWQAVALVLRRELPLGRSWLYMPRGPVFPERLPPDAAWQALMKALAALAQREAAFFIRCDPAVGTAWLARLRASEWQKADHEVQPRSTLIVDLGLSEAEILARMHAKTRYNIRLAQRKGVTIRFATDPDAVESFITLSRQVAERTQFRYHPEAYYRAMQAVLTASGQFAVGLAEYQGIVLAAHILIQAGTTVTYAHGASSSQWRELMAPHLLHWESLRWAQRRGATRYDFFGIAPAGATSNHPWAGITRFKEGFGGERADYVGAYDLVMDRTWYPMLRVARQIRASLR